MARLHIIYDPSDKVISQPDMENKLKLKVATLSVSENMTNDELLEYAQNLAILLLEQVTHA